MLQLWFTAYDPREADVSAAWREHEYNIDHIRRLSQRRPRHRPKYAVLSRLTSSLHANKLTVRTTRARIIHLRNDYKALMSKIEHGLHEHHAAYQASNTTSTLSSAQMASSSSASDQGLVDTPFAKVSSVAAGSPADDAGLKTGDRIRKFGNVNWINHEKLSRVAEVVQRNQGVC